jgi:hypothetical protein
MRSLRRAPPFRKRARQTDREEVVMDRVFTFDTTHHALWAEELAAEAGIPAEVVPAPAAATARCDLAIRTLPDDVARLGAVLDRQDLPYRIFPEG